VSLAAIVLASLLAPASGAEEASGDFKCAEEIVEGTARRAEDMHAYVQACIETWLPPYLATAAPTLRPSGKAVITRYGSAGDGASCGPDGDDEGGDVAMRFIVLVPVRGDETVSHLVLRVETVLGFCHEKSRTVLGGAIEKATLIP
jgi:ADP-ribosylglycohydrolase